MKARIRREAEPLFLESRKVLYCQLNFMTWNFWYNYSRPCAINRVLPGGIGKEEGVSGIHSCPHVPLLSARTTHCVREPRVAAAASKEKM